MFELAREIFVCACSTDVSDDDPAETRALSFAHGSAADLARLHDHDDETITAMRARLERGEDWLVGELDGEIVTYTFLSTAPSFDYPALPGCAFALGDDVAYGSGAWTPPALRGRGYRRRAFLEELRWLRQIDKKWEASVFVASQLAPAQRSLAAVGITVEPLWRVVYTRERRLEGEPLVGDDRVRPLF